MLTSKNNKKIFLLLIIACFLLSFGSALAVTLEVPLPGTSGSVKSVSNPAQYIQYFFIFGLSLIGFLAVAAMAVGGIMWMMGGSITSTEKARNIIVGAVSGVVLLLCSYLLLYTIDPSLVNLTPHIKNLGTISAPPTPATIPQCQTGFEYVWPQGCIPQATGIGTAECQVKTPPTCTESRCITGGCTARNLIWERSQCACVQPPAPITFP
ncbi:MAG: Uncharacterized protein LiPW39_334 [Parcubacteria group bacterium LiPW_39]|nr:MAG: Uncharacterized protein LiPW39_334 [Parcubacteria group bacterium LiPW_39]